METLSCSMPRWASALLVCSALGLGACSSVSPPQGVLSQAELAVSEAGSSRAPQLAPTELNQARTRLDAAKRAMEAERYLEARRQAEKALVDAQFAEAKSEAEADKRVVQELQKSIDALQQEAERKSSATRP